MNSVIRVLSAGGAGEKGQDLVEYALIIALVVIVVAILLPTLAATLVNVYYSQVVPALGG